MGALVCWYMLALQNGVDMHDVVSFLEGHTHARVIRGHITDEDIWSVRVFLPSGFLILGGHVIVSYQVVFSR